MNKKYLIIAAIILVLIIVAVLYFHFTPVWASAQVVIAGVIGLLIGWFAKVLYDKYIKA